MWFAVLGRMEVRQADGAEVPISGRARRRLLAALLCRAGSPATAATLIDDLWGAAAPRTALGTLRSHMVRLRDDLGRAGAGELVHTEGDGYRLAIGADDLDATRFERLAAEAATLAEPDVAISRYDQALALWRDDAYIEFGDAPFAVGQRTRLGELRALACERRTDLALALGRCAQLVSDLEQAVRAQPYRERGWEQLALALFGSGRQADALLACRRARRVLAEDLGVDPGEGLRTLEQRLLRHDPELIQTAPAAVTRRVNRCPYFGLAGYEEHDAALFVGRERLTALLVARLADQSVVVVTGASGVGKSSLVRAGLVPALRAGAFPGSAAWRLDVRTPADGTLGEGRVPDLLILDQAEQLFTLADAHREQLLRRLTSYVDDQDGRVVVVLRSDYYGRIADVEVLAPFAEKATMLVGPMRADELRRALVEPAAKAGLRLEPDLIETIMEAVAGQPEPLPLLSEAMVRTWQRRDGDVLTLEAYRAAGELAGALAAAAEECYGGLGDAERTAVRHLLMRMAARTESGWMRRPIALMGFRRSAVEHAALAALVSARLVVTSNDRLEIAHDALLLHWPRMRGWLSERIAAAELLDGLCAAARTWNSAGQPDTDLWRGARLQTALDWREEHPDGVSAEESTFLDASAAAAEDELREARRRAAVLSRARRRLLCVAAGLAVALVLAGAVGVVSLRERSSAQTAARAAEVRGLAASSSTAPDLATAALMAVAAYRLGDSPASRGALLSALERGRSAAYRIPTPGHVISLVAASDGSALFALDSALTVHTLDPHRRSSTLSWTQPTINDLIGETNGVLIAHGTGTGAPRPGRLVLLRTSDGSVQQVLDNRTSASFDRPALSTDGRWLVAVRSSSAPLPGATLEVFDARDWQRPPRTLSLPAGILQVAVTAHLLAAESSTRTLYLIDPATLRIERRQVEQDLPDRDAADLDSGRTLFALSPDGRRLGYTSNPQDATPTILSLPSLSTVATASIAFQPPAATLTFSPDGNALAVAHQDGTLEVLRAGDGRLTTDLAGEGASVAASVWSAAGLFTAGIEPGVLAWDVAPTAGVLRFGGAAVRTVGSTARFGGIVIGETPPLTGLTPGTAARLLRLDLHTGRWVTSPAHLHAPELEAQLSTTPTGDEALSSIQDVESGADRWQLQDLRSGRVLSAIAPPAAANQRHYLAAALLPHARTAAVALGAGRVGILALPSGRLLRIVSLVRQLKHGARLWIEPLCSTASGALLVATNDSQGRSHELVLIDLGSGHIRAQAVLPGGEYPVAVEQSHDHRLLAVGTDSGALQVFDAFTLRLLRQVPDAQPGVADSVSFSPDDRTVVTAGSDGSMSFWDTRTGAREGDRVTIPGAQAPWYAWYRSDGTVTGLAPDPASPGTDNERAFTFPGKPDQWVRAACTLAGSQITRSQWARWVGDAVPYRPVCG